MAPVPADELASAAIALQRCCVTRSSTIHGVLATLERSGLRIVLVVEGERLLGTVTDGDVRRALLAGASLDSVIEPFMQRNFISVPPAATRAEVLDLMQSQLIEQVPILDAEGCVKGLHLLHEMLGALERPNWAVIMAGGRGTRLGLLTESVPKPMIRVAGRPILERIVLHLVGFGVRRIFLSINYLGDVVERHFADGSRFGCQIEYLREEQPLGTGGSLALLREKPHHPLLVMNGDLVTQADIASMLEFHSRNGQVATIGTYAYAHVVPFGCIELAGTRVVRLTEKPRLTHLVNAGIYVLDPQLLERVPRGIDYSLPTLIESCLDRGEEVHAFEIQGDWIDVGQRDQLRIARGEVAPLAVT